MIRRCFYVELLAALLISTGVIILISRIWIYDLIISSIFVLSPNSLIYEFWRKPPVTVKTDFYFFNWTNPEEISNLTSKPKFEQVGPYIFKIETEKVNITWNKNHTVTFRMLQQYYFDEENSKGKLTDMITTLNTVTVSAAHKLRYESYFKKKGFSFSLGLLSPTLHIVKPVGQLLFDGYEDPYVDIYNALPFLKDNTPEIDKAGFLYGRNNSYTIDGTYSVATGVDGNIGEIFEWNYHNRILQNDADDSCSDLGGSIGEFYSQRKNKNPIKMFIADTCKNYKLDFEEEVLVRGIPGYKYSARHSTLDNGTLVPENKCYCGGECVPSGTMNITTCAYGAPTFISLPHFYGADSYYVDQVEGLKPEKSKHEFFVTLEPRIGFCVDIALRLQFNFLLHPVEYITLFEEVPRIFFPILWSEQRVTVPNNFAVLIKILLSVPNIILPVIAIAFILSGLLLVAYRRCKPKEKFPRHYENPRLETEASLLKHKQNSDNKAKCILSTRYQDINCELSEIETLKTAENCRASERNVA